MLHYWKDEKRIECCSVDHRGHVGQIVVFDYGSFKANNPFPQYPQPAFFTIAETAKGEDGFYVLADSWGNRITLHFNERCYLYDIDEWTEWNKGNVKEKIAQKTRRIASLESHVVLLKSILTNQVHVITEEQARVLHVNLPV